MKSIFNEIEKKILFLGVKTSAKSHLKVFSEKSEINWHILFCRIGKYKAKNINIFHNRI